MNWLAISVALFTGFCFGLLVAFALRLIQAKTAKELADELFRESEDQRKAAIEEVIENVKTSFGNLSLEALSKSTDEFLKLAKARLESEREIGIRELTAKKSLIDQELKNMSSELENVSKLMGELENDRAEKFGELTNQLKAAGEQTIALAQTTNKLREALANTKLRGQWGERMAEDVLRLAGFIENVNYLKQKAIEGTGTRPDFTFLLPRSRKLNMDVKFPSDNYVKFLETDLEIEKEKFRKDFLRDVKARIKEVTTREYINPEQNTVDCVLLFIPNGRIYAFIHEQDSSIFDDGIRNKVVFCSPITLFAVLAVIRQAVDNFTLEQTSNEILSLLGAFKKQWGMFLEKLKLLGKRIEDTQAEYLELTNLRQRQLEKPLNKIEYLRTEHGLPVAADEDEKTLPVSEEAAQEAEEDR